VDGLGEFQDLVGELQQRGGCATSGLTWALIIPFAPWLTTLILSNQPLVLAGQLAVVFRETGWALAIALGLTLPFLLLPDG
jgi:hypothetical protein